MASIDFFDGEGSLHSNLDGELRAFGTGSDYAGTMTIQYGYDVDTETNIQYHTSRCIAIWFFAKVGYQPNIGDQTGGNDFKNTGAINPKTLVGQSMTQYRVDAAPIDGLKIGADYANTDGSTATAQEAESGAYCSVRNG